MLTLRKLFLKNTVKSDVIKVYPRFRSRVLEWLFPVDLDAEQIKLELIEKMKSNENPFNMKVYKRELGTANNPTEIPSAFDARLVGCICEEESVKISWMWLYKGKPKKCDCGYWFTLVHKKLI